MKCCFIHFHRGSAFSNIEMADRFENELKKANKDVEVKITKAMDITAFSPIHHDLMIQLKGHQIFYERN